MAHSLEAFRRIRRLQIKALRSVNDLFAGNYRSAFKGKGLEFEDVREYEAGDDIRRIDWNVSARSQGLYVKNYREERELTVILCVDLSASSYFSHTGRLKSELIAELAALLALSAIKNQDKVGLLLFTEGIELYLKPKKGLAHVLRVIRELLYFTPKRRGTDLSQALKFIGKVERKRSICFIISDFLAKNFSWEAALLAERHELIAFHVSDSFEQSFTPQGFFHFNDLETGKEAYVDTAHPAVQRHFNLLTDKKAKEIKKLFQRIGADYLTIRTDESSDSILQRFFRLRGRRR